MTARSSRPDREAFCFDLPFLPKPAYIEFLRSRAERVEALHFSLFSEKAADARHRFRRIPADELIAGLLKIRGPKRYALLNSRFHKPEDYPDSSAIEGMAELLERFLSAGAVDGIIFADFYLLQALSDHVPDTASHLEAVPSINALADSFDKVRAVREMIDATRFRPPGKIILDRSLNRDISGLRETVSRCRKAFPDMRIGLMANEGCLLHCPFKLTHDAHIALTHLGFPADTYELNRRFGCIRQLREAPHRIFRSPFIRPEDLRHYAPTADFIKICGRTLGAPFLMKTASAYFEGEFKGSLPEILDASHWMTDFIRLPNHRFPDDFFEQLTRCRGDCESCGWCEKLFGSIGQRETVILKDLRTGESGGLP